MEKQQERRPSRSVTPERRLYRQGSLSSQIFGDEELLPMNTHGSRLNSVGSKSGSIRSRTPSGKSIRSRIATRQEYHEDLKPDLKRGITCHLFLVANVVFLCTSFLFGYNIGCLNQPSRLIQEFYNETYIRRNNETIDGYMLTFLWSLTTALSFPGGMIGAYTVGFLADRIGRKGAVYISEIPAIIGAVLSCVCQVAHSPELLMVGRFITGINCGMATQLGPMYVLEIVPYNLKGAFGTANQLYITIGIFMGSVFGLREILGTDTLWPFILLINAGPALLAFIMLPFFPDSPRYLMLIKKDRDQAEKALQFLRQTDDVSADLEEMDTEDHEDSQQENFTMKRLFQTKELRMPLFIAVFLQIIQQLSGVNAIFFYSESIYTHAGVALKAIQYAIIITNGVNVLMTIIAVPIMDKAGRRPLLLYPMIVMCIDLAIITVALNLQEKYSWMSYISIVCVITYVIGFALGLGPIAWMIGAEIFRQGPRPRAMSIAGLTNWLFTMIVAISFELIQKAIKAYTFIIFLVLMIGFTIFVYFKIPETKNKTFEEIASQFQPGKVIEVEELVDDEPYFGDIPPELQDNEKSKLMNGDTRDSKEKLAESPDQDDDAENVTIHFPSEEKRSLTKLDHSAKNINA